MQPISRLVILYQRLVNDLLYQEKFKVYEKFSFLYLCCVNKRTKYIGQLIRKKVNKIDTNAEIILYGSRARGTESLDSDWDILVLTDYPMDLKKEQMFRSGLYDLELETGEPFSLFAFSKKEWKTKQKITPFYYNVMLDGIQL